MDRVSTLIESVFKQHRWSIHLFFWVSVLVFYTLFFGRRSDNYSQTFFFVGLLMPVTVSLSYFLNYYLIPEYLLKGKYFRFVVYFAYAIIFSLFLEMMVAVVTFIVQAEVHIRKMSLASFDLFFLLSALMLVVFLSGAIKMIFHWQNSKEDYQELMREKVEVELRFLKTQLHPHFLFNTLNNLYYLALEKSDQTPKAILALGEILDYVLHETKNEFVSLERELKQVENYIALELLRYGDRLKVEIKVEDDISGLRIAPMMLITLIENSFKHGVSQTSRMSWINLRIKNKNKDIIIILENSIPAKLQLTKPGVGLQNLRNQIELLYASKARLITESFENRFSVKLELPI